LLIVDRYGGIRETIAALLEDRDYRLSCVSDGASMRRLLEDNRIDKEAV